MGNKGVSMSINTMVIFILAVVLIVVGFFFVKNYVLDSARSIADCDKNHGTCMPVCASGMVHVPAYKCSDESDMCCKDMEDVTGIPGTGLKCKDLLGDCVNSSEDCEDGTINPTADCEDEDKECCVPDKKNECEDQGGNCMENCPPDEKENEEYRCSNTEHVCCTSS